jgi:hypothetical protein
VESVEKRAYNSPLREQQAEQTRERILQAMAKVLEDASLQEVTFSALAKAAQVSERTVYRHFPNKEELDQAFWWWVNKQIGMTHYPETPEELLSMPPVVFEGFDRYEPMIRAHIRSAAGEELRAKQVPGRQAAYKKMLGPLLDGLQPKQQQQALAVIQLLFSPRAWDSMKENWGLSGKQAGQASAWAINVLLDHLRANQKTEKP